MRDISDAADLMTTAREALLRDLLPALSGERRYAALMIANGMPAITGERGIEHFAHFGPRHQPRCDFARTCLVPLHPHAQRA